MVVTSNLTFQVKEKLRPHPFPGRVFTSRNGLDGFLEAIDVDGVVALVHGPCDVPDEAHADLLGDASPRGLGDAEGESAGAIVEDERRGGGGGSEADLSWTGEEVASVAAKMVDTLGDGGE
jgi:hypothetical protein